MGLPALAALTIGPSLVLVHFVWSRDRRREPAGNLLVYFLLGAVAVVPAAFLETVLQTPILGGIVAGIEALPTAVWAFLGVAFVEEAAKLGLLWSRTRTDRHLDEPFDWLVYAVAISLGFATLENVFYVMEGGAAVAMSRAITAVPSHALDGTMMGWRLARAHTRTGASAQRERALALFEPVAWHGGYDYLLMMAAEAETNEATVFGYAWLALVVGQWVVCARRLTALCREQHVPVPPLLAPVEIARRILGR